VQRGDDRDQQAAHGEADQRHQVEETDEDAERHRQLDAQQLERQPGEYPSQRGEQQVDRDVRADDARDPAADAPHALALGHPDPPGDPLEVVAAVEQQEVREGEHDHRLDHVVEDPHRDLLGGAGRVAELGREL
jgi:hypothetical protein